MKTSLAALLLLAACGASVTNSTYRGPQLASIHGTVTFVPGAKTDGQLRMALVWTSVVVGPDMIPSATIITPQDVAYDASSFTHYQFDLTAPPPAEALTDLTALGGSGKMAQAVLLVYRDGNANGRLDLIGTDGVADDQVVGSSTGPAFEYGGDKYELFYVDSAMGPADAGPGNDMPAFPALVQGYNLVKSDFPRGLVAVPMSTSVDIAITDDPALNVYVCRTLAPFAAGGICHSPTASPLSAIATFEKTELTSSASVQVIGPSPDGGTVAVFVNSRLAPYQADAGAYVLPDANLNAGSSNDALVVSPGATNLVLSGIMPGDFQITAPLAGSTLTSGSVLDVHFTAASFADVYRVTATDAQGHSSSQNFAEVDGGVSFPLPGYLGAVTLTVTASRLTPANSGSLVVSQNERSVAVQLVP